MHSRGRRAGFSLIELMIVICIIAIIAAIAIVGLLSIRRASNEKATGASLKSATTAEETFKNNDLDQNRISDYWTGDLCGLFAIRLIAGSGNPVRALNDIGMASADTDVVVGFTNGTVEHPGLPMASQPKSGYWFQALVRDQQGVDLMINNDATMAVHNDGSYAFCAVPASYGNTGSYCYLVNQSNAIFRMDLAALTPVIVVPVSRFTLPELDQYPSSPTLAASWSKAE